MVKKEKQSREENKKNPYKTVVLIFLGILLMGFAYAITTISDQEITTTGNVTTANLNGVWYVQAGNGSDIQVKIDLCPNIGCRVVIPSGDYALDNTVNLTSNLTLEIQSGASIFWNTGATPQELTDLQATVFNQMIFGNQLENINIFNYGIIQPRREFNPANGDQAVHINDSINIYIHGGHLEDSDSGYTIYNSQDIIIENIYSNLLNEAVWQECTNYTQITNVVCIAGGFEGECIEMNGYSQYVTISDITINGGFPFNDQAIDLNANRYVTLNNIVANNAYKLILASPTSGIRFGTCSSITGGHISGTNLLCDNCNTTSVINTENSSLLIQENNTGFFYQSGLKIIDKDPNILLKDSSTSAEIDTFGFFSDGGSFYLKMINKTDNVITNLIRFTEDVGMRFLNSETHPFYITRKESTIESINISVGDVNVIFESVQDENSGSNGGFRFIMDDDGSASPNFLIEEKGGEAIVNFNNNSGMTLGDGTDPMNITLTSPDGAEHNCGVSNAGVFECT